MTQTRFESFNEFKPVWDIMPAGSVAYRVKCYDGNTGNYVGSEYSFDEDDIEDMQCVAAGYYTETTKLTKK